MCTQHREHAHLTQEDRLRIETLFDENYSCRAIARSTDIDVSVISRERSRNKAPSGTYCAAKAQKIADERRAESKPIRARSRTTPILATKIETALRGEDSERGDWSPEVIANVVLPGQAHPYHPWERGTHERTNGLVRRYFPKGQKFASLSSDDVAKVVWRLNHRPRKIFHWRTPCDVFGQCCISACN